MSSTRIISIILIVVGAGLLLWGYQLSGSLESSISKTLTGSMPENVMWHDILGAASLIVGLFLFFKKG